MPVYNAGQYLSTAIDSILKQSFKEFELILVDDGSSDGSSELCDKYAQKDNRIIVIHQKNKGICNARNTALNIARGEYIGFSDHDDEYHPELLNNNYRLAKKYNADIIKFGRSYYLIDKGKIKKEVNIDYNPQIYSSIEIKKAYFYLFKQKALTCIWDGLYRSQFLRDNHIIFNERFKMGGEDADFMKKCIIHANKFVCNQGIYYYHYIRNKFSTSTKYNPNKISDSKYYLNEMKQFSENMGWNYINNKELHSEITYLLILQVLGPICSTLSSPGCDKTKKDKIMCLKEISSLLEKNQLSFIKKVSIRNLDISLKYKILLWMFNHKLYSVCLAMYNLKVRFYE